MGLNSAPLDRWLQVQRATYAPDGSGGFEYTWSDLGEPLRTRRRDVSDGERMVAASWTNRHVIRFVIRASAFSRGIRHEDRIVHEAEIFNIDGIKELPGRRAFLELTVISEPFEEPS
jgi:head-tail adaptor